MYRAILRKNRQFSKGRSRDRVIAAIDLGTTSCRLLIAQPDKDSFRVVDSYSKVVRLGEGLQESSRLHTDAIERAYQALEICRSKLSKHANPLLRCVTTEACRRAENRDDLLNRVHSDLGLEIEVISTKEEARLALAGCAAILSTKIPYAVAFDIGGGSTEIMWLKVSAPARGSYSRIPLIEVIDSASLPFGVVTLSEIYGTNFIEQDVYQELRLKIAQEVMKFSVKNNIDSYIQAGQVQMAGTSGTVTTIGAIHLKLEKYDRRFIDGLFLNIPDIHEVSKNLLAMTYEQRAKNACIGPGRADLVIMGTVILEGICDTWSLPRLRVADRGVREGILMDLLGRLS